MTVNKLNFIELTLNDYFHYNQFPDKIHADGEQGHYPENEDNQAYFAFFEPDTEGKTGPVVQRPYREQRYGTQRHDLPCMAVQMCDESRIEKPAVKP